MTYKTLAAALTLLPLGILAQEDTALHRAAYAEINSKQKTYHYSKVAFDDEHAEVKLEAWDDAGTLRKIVASISGEHGSGTEEYYVEGGLPLFVYTKYNTVNMHTGKVEAVVEDRHYFMAGNMFKWLDSEKKQVAPASDEFAAQAEAIKADFSEYAELLGFGAPGHGERREPLDGEIAEHGNVTKVEDAGYPMVVVSMIFGKGRVEGEFTLNCEEIGVSEADLRKLKGKEAVRFFYAVDDMDILHDLRIAGNSVFGEDAPELDPEWDIATGVLGGAGEETAGDLPDEITLTTGKGEELHFKTFITPEIVAVNGKKVAAYFGSSPMHPITYFELPE